MTITFENDNDVIVYTLEKVISYARRTEQIFVAQCVWWLASVIGLEQGLITFIDNIQSRVAVTIRLGQVPEELATVATRSVSTRPRDIQEESRQNDLGSIHPDRSPQDRAESAVSPAPRNLTEKQRLDRILGSAERVIQESFRDWSRVQSSRINPLPMTKTQLKKARKVKRLQEENRKKEVEKNQRLQEIWAEVICHLSKE
jgi:hypothetical protein